MDIKKNPDLNLKSNFKNFLHFRRELAKPKKQTKKSSVKQFLISCDVLRIFTAVNQRVNPCEAKYNTDILLIITASSKTAPSKQLFIPIIRISNENTKNNRRHKGRCLRLIIFSSEVINFENSNLK